MGRGMFYSSRGFKATLDSLTDSLRNRAENMELAKDAINIAAGWEQVAEWMSGHEGQHAMKELYRGVATWGGLTGGAPQERWFNRYPGQKLGMVAKLTRYEQEVVGRQLLALAMETIDQQMSKD